MKSCDICTVESIEGSAQEDVLEYSLWDASHTETEPASQLMRDGLEPRNLDQLNPSTILALKGCAKKICDGDCPAWNVESALNALTLNRVNRIFR